MEIRRRWTGGCPHIISKSDYVNSPNLGQNNPDRNIVRSQFHLDPRFVQLAQKKPDTIHINPMPTFCWQQQRRG